EVQRAGALALATGEKELRVRSILRLTVTRVLDETDNLDIRRPARTRPHPLADWRRPHVELARERFVDNRDLRRPADIGTRELPARQQRNTQRLEIVRPDAGRVRARTRVGVVAEAFHR